MFYAQSTGAFISGRSRQNKDTKNRYVLTNKLIGDELREYFDSSLNRGDFYFCIRVVRQWDTLGVLSKRYLPLRRDMPKLLVHHKRQKTTTTKND